MPVPTVIRSLNTIRLSGRLNAESIPPLVEALRAGQTAGFEDFKLDFSECQVAFTNGMVPLAAIADAMLAKGVEFELVLPNEPAIARHFENTGLAHFIDAGRFSEVKFCASEHVPIRRFRDHKEQHALVDTFMDIFLKSTSLSREVLGGLEWSLNEVMDNVPNHAEASAGGYASLTTLANSVSFTVADCGCGILASLREGHPKLANDTEALGEAIKAGVTRNKQAGQGNGLAGTLSIATTSGGSFSISSGRGRLNVFHDVKTSKLASLKKSSHPSSDSKAP